VKIGEREQDFEEEVKERQTANVKHGWREPTWAPLVQPSAWQGLAAAAAASSSLLKSGKKPPDLKEGSDTPPHEHV
jgi:hypothetical protein